MEQDNMHPMMKNRYMPHVPHDLAERIIFQAVSTVPQRPRNFWAEFTAMFTLPHPSYVMAVAIVLGLAVGLQAGDGLNMLGQDWSSFLDINEGGWL
jgi:hypothetical protein